MTDTTADAQAPEAAPQTPAAAASQPDATPAAAPPAAEVPKAAEPPAPPKPPAQPSPEFMARIDGLLAGATKLNNPQGAWILDQIKAAIGEQQQAQQQLQQLNAAQAQAKSAADIGQGKVAALLPVLERSEASSAGK